MNKNIFFIFFLLVVSLGSAKAQLYFNAGIGTMNYAGDLQQKKVTFKESKYGITLGGTYQFAPNFAANLNLTYGKVTAADSKNDIRWFYRNLDFTSNIFEAAATLEYDLFDISNAAGSNYDNPDAATERFTPYLFGGIGIFNFNPYTHYNGQKVFLQPLKTEGELTPYPLWGVSFPIGLGVKYAISDNVMIAAEMNYRKTNTDNMDDVSAFHFVDTTTFSNPLAASVSYRADEIPGTKYPFYGQRGNPTKKDNYYCFLIKVIFKFGQGETLFKYGYGN